jgi:hypothetical protein
MSLPMRKLWWKGAAPLLFFATGGVAQGQAGIHGVVNRHPEGLIGLPEATNPQATVSAIGASGTRTAATNDGGEFSFGDLTPGAYRLEFKKQTIAWSVERVLVCPRMISMVETRDPRARSRFEGERMGARLRNPPPPAGYLYSPQGGAGIAGQIRTPDRQGIPGVHLSAERLADHSKFAAMTDEKGEYQFTNLRPGDYRVTISGPSVRPDSAPVVKVLDGLEYRFDRDECRL